MPLITQPALIEQSDFSGGWGPDGLNESTDPTVLLDVLNLLIDRHTGSLQTRDGYRRLREELSTVTDGEDITADHYVKQLAHFGTEGTQYLIAVVVKNAAEANNVQLFRINLSTNAGARIDDPGVTWANPTKMFWFQSIDGILYGGSKGNRMFSWHPTDGWDDDVSTPNTKEWVDDTGASVNTASEYGRDFAWTGKEFVEYSGDIYMPTADIRYADWDEDDRYKKGDFVSCKLNGYYRSYKCTADHQADAAKKPDSGADWNDYWDRKKLPKPVNDDGETSPQWAFIPESANTSISMWFADRLFLRFDGQGDNSRAQYSAPVKPDKNEDIPETTWNPRDWAPGNDNRGQGGGWVPFNDGAHGGAIQAMHAFGQYGIIFKRKSVWVISGQDESTWSVRRVARGIGCVGSQAKVELDGLVYFLDDQGLSVTDGTQAEEVPANARIQQWIQHRLDSSLDQMQSDGAQPTLFKQDGFVGISIPDASNEDDPYVTLFYDPVTQSFWKTDLPVLDWQGYVDDGVHKAAFCRAPESDSDSPLDLVYVYDKANADDTDDTGEADYAAQDIPWYLSPAWLPFGTVRAERRIRRLWWVVKGAMTMSITQYRNWQSSAEVDVDRTAPAVAGHIEGLWMADSHVIRTGLEGPEAPAKIYGYGVDTEPRRLRYHTN